MNILKKKQEERRLSRLVLVREQLHFTAEEWCLTAQEIRHFICLRRYTVKIVQQLVFFFPPLPKQQNVI